MIRLLIADDHAIVRSGLKQIFGKLADMDVVGEADCGAQVLDRVRSIAMDLLLLDLNMPGLSGVELIQHIKVHRADLPILVLSMHNDPMIAARMLKAGASGYITKDCEPEILFEAVRRVAAGQKYIDPELAEKMVFDAMSNAPQQAHSRLSNREMEVFQLLAAGHNVKAVGEKLLISSKTVSTHKARLMEKLQVSNLAGLTRYAIQHDIKI